MKIGAIIKNKFDESGMTLTAFADKINSSRSNVYDIFERDTIDTGIFVTDIDSVIFFQHRDIRTVEVNETVSFGD